MKKALFILMTFALIGFAGCKQATGSSSGGGGDGDTNPLIGTWVNTHKNGSISRPNDWSEEKTTFTVEAARIMITNVPTDYGTEFSGIKAEGYGITTYYKYSIDTNECKITMQAYDISWDDENPIVEAQFQRSGLSTIEEFKDFVISSSKPSNRLYKITDNELVFAYENSENPGNYTDFIDGQVYIKQ